MGKHLLSYQIDSGLPIDLFYDFLDDPVFMQKVVFDREMHPAQRLQTRLMWFNPFYVDTSGYRLGKSSNATYVQMQQCLLIPGWQSGILSHTMRGAQYLFRDHIDYQYNTNPFFRAMCVKKPTHGNEWRVEFINASSITAFPSDILNNSQRLESLSLHDATIDEATTFPRPEVLWDVMFNRITMPPPPLAQRLGITNSVRVLGAAKFTFQLIYKAQNERGGLIHLMIRRMQEWAEGDMKEPMEHVSVSWNLEEHLPPDESCWACGGVNDHLGRDDQGRLYVQCRSCGYKRVAWHDFFKTVLKRMRDARELMSNKLYAMRWLGKWQDTSDDVYNPGAVREMPRPDAQVELKRMDDEAIYVMGLDIGTGATERHSPSAAVIIKIKPPDPHYRFVYAEKYACSLSELSGHVYRLWKAFRLNIVMLDSGGGGVWLVDRDHLGGTRQKILTSSGMKWEEKTTPLISLDDFMSEYGARVVQMFTPACMLLKESIGTMVASDQMINWAHDLLSGMIDNSLCIAPINSRMANGRSSRRSSVILGHIQEALEGLMSIGVVQDPTGDPQLTKNGFFEYYPKPDLAYALVYGIAATYLYMQADKERLQEDEAAGISMLAAAYDFTHSTKKDAVPEDKEETAIALISG